MTCHKKLTDPFVIKNRMLALIECGLEAAKRRKHFARNKV
jgi:hypothetical protein